MSKLLSPIFQGDVDGGRSLCSRLCSIASSAASSGTANPDELLYGRAGCLWAVLFARRHCPEGQVEREVVQVWQALL